MTPQNQRGKLMQILDDIRSFFADYHVWALVVMGACFVIILVLFVMGKKAQNPGPGFKITWDEDPLEWKSSSEATAPYWPLFHEVRRSLTPEPNRVPLFRVFRGTTDQCRNNHGDAKVVMESRQRGTAGDRYKPEIIGFVLREKDGYFQVADLNPQTGMPRDVTKGYDRTVPVPQYGKGERLVIIVFAEVSSQAKFQEIRELNAEQLVRVEVKPANARP
jgi:hypothetical protein